MSTASSWRRRDIAWAISNSPTAAIKAAKTSRATTCGRTARSTLDRLASIDWNTTPPLSANIDSTSALKASGSASGRSRTIVPHHPKVG